MDDVITLNAIEQHLTEIMITGEHWCAKKVQQRQAWSPKQRNIARNYSYWKQKKNMSIKRLFNRPHLNQLRIHTDVLDYEHSKMDSSFIWKKKRQTRSLWRSCKKKSESICLQFWNEKAKLLASKMRTTEEKALKAIIKVEQSRRIFSNINEIFGKPNKPLTQVDVQSDPTDKDSLRSTISCREE